MAGTAVRGRLNTWQTATVGPVTDETPKVRTLRLEVPDWIQAMIDAGRRSKWRSRG